MGDNHLVVNTNENIGSLIEEHYNLIIKVKLAKLQITGSDGLSDNQYYFIYKVYNSIQ